MLDAVYGGRIAYKKIDIEGKSNFEFRKAVSGYNKKDFDKA